MLSTKHMFFFQLRKDADGKRLFCSNVSTLLSMIVGKTQRAYYAPYHKVANSEARFLLMLYAHASYLQETQTDDLPFPHLERNQL